MKAQSTGPLLSTVFVDYDNIYLSLKRKNEDAAKRFAKDAGSWIAEIASGRLITATNGLAVEARRRIVLNRCYGNPVPRRNNSDNSTDMNSFPFVRHHFLRAGFEVIDCPPLTSQLKNSADIRMVMDVRDLIAHDTYFDEFIILSGDADFTPLLHRLRAHARRTVVYANDHTAQPYTAISDGEVREADLLALLLDGRVISEAEPNRATESVTTLAAAEPAPAPAATATPIRDLLRDTPLTQPAPAPASPPLPTAAQLDAARREIIGEVISVVRASTHPVPLEALADRAVRMLGHDKTVGSAWGGTGSFRDLLARGLPDPIRLSEQPPFVVFDTSRQLSAPRKEYAEPARIEPPAPRTEAPLRAEPAVRADYQDAQRYARPPVFADAPPVAAPAAPQRAAEPASPQRGVPAPRPSYAPAAEAPQQRVAAPLPAAPAPRAEPAPQPDATARSGDGASAIQQSIARIHEACQAPPLSPPEYRALFEVMAQEITANGLSGAATLTNIVANAGQLGVEVRRDDVRFVLEVVSEPDPWFEQGASASLFASRFRNFVVARCRSQGLNLSADELDLIEAWFAGAPQAARQAPASRAAAPQSQPQAPQPAPRQQQAAPAAAAGGERWWNLEDGRQHVAETRIAGDRFGAGHGEGGDELPRFVRTRR